MAYTEKRHCNQCDKETTHEVEQTGRVDVQYGHGHNDDHEVSIECLECGHTTLDI